MVKEKDVNPNDSSAPEQDHGLSGLPSHEGKCDRSPRIRELRSDSEEVVTVPNGSCSPSRLRLDHGRLSSMD
jgi:hypothetical protein